MEGMMSAREDVLAFGERVIRRCPCTAVDSVAMFAGTVIPLPGTVESEGVITLTNKRLIFDLDADSGKAAARQEVRISDISSISSMMSKFGRDLRVPLLFIVLGFIIMFTPYVVLTETGAFNLDMEYEDGYNDGVEYGYYEAYLRAVQSGETSHRIPPGYYFYPMEPPVSAEYARGYSAGAAAGRAGAAVDVEADLPFEIPAELFIHSNPTGLAIGLAAVGAVVFVMGSVLYLLSNRTKDWIVLRFGSGGRGVFVTSVRGGWSETGYRALTAEDRYWDMTRDIGAAILEIRNYRSRGLRVVEDDSPLIETVQEEPVPEEREMLEPAPDFEDYSEELIIDDDDPRVVGPWGERS